jgi:hypothetical protein
MLSKFRWFIPIVCLVLLPACGLSSGAKPTAVPVAVTRVIIHIPTKAPASTVVAATPTSAATAVAAAGGQVPGSCEDLAKLVGSYVGGVATTKSLATPTPTHLSCEYFNAAATTIVILNIGAGATASAFDTLRTGSAQGGRTVTSINGLGASAFSVSKGGVTSGVSVLTAQGMLYVVESNLTQDQDVALIKQLMAL